MSAFAAVGALDLSDEALPVRAVPPRAPALGLPVTGAHIRLCTTGALVISRGTH